MKENCLCIRNYINSDPSSKNHSRYRKELVAKIDDPGVMDKSSILADDSPLRKEAQIIIDAFESVTNGMENTEALIRLGTINKNSVFASWKYLTLAVKSFYDRNFESMEGFLTSIEKDAPPEKLIPVLLHLADIKPLDSANRSLKNFLNLIQKDRSIFTDTRELLKDALSNDMEDLFSETVVLLVRDVKKRNPEAAEKLALWSIIESSDRDFSQTYLMRNYKTIFGQSRGLQLFAHALAAIEPDISVLFWIQSLTARLKQGDTTRLEAAAYVKIISDQIDRALIEKQIEKQDKDFFDGFSNLITRMHQECSIYFPDIISGKTGSNPFETFKLLRNEIVGTHTLLKPEPSNSVQSQETDTLHSDRLTQTVKKKKDPIQLSLF